VIRNDVGETVWHSNEEICFGPKGWTLVIRAFFDDSGKESDLDNRIVCVAGYLAPDGLYWETFGQTWRHQLFKHGISWLHMKDFMQDQDEYKKLGWDWPKKKEVLDNFVAVIRGSQLIGVGVGVDAAAWKKIPKEVTKIQGDAQQFCFLRIMKMIVDRVKATLPRDFVSVHFDCDIAFTPARFHRFLGVREHDEDAKAYLKSFSVSDAKIFLPLQAADLLAWESRKELIRKIGGFESRPEFQRLFEIIPGFPADYIGEFWNEEEIENRILKKIKDGGQIDTL